MLLTLALLAGGATAADAAVVLPSFGAVAGRVVSESGSPLSGCSVYADGGDLHGSTTSTAADGLFVLWLGDHDYAVRAECTDRSSVAASVRGTGEGVVELGDVAAYPAARLSGHVLRWDGSPAGGAVVGLVDDRGNAQPGPIVADADGMYTAQVPPGTYSVTARPGYGDHTAENAHGSRAPVLVEGAPVVDADVTLGRAASITGRVTTQGVAAAGIGVTATRTSPDGVRLGYWAMTDGNGVYALQGLRGGDYEIAFGSSAQRVLRSVTVAPGQVAAGVDVRTQDGAGPLSGLVTSADGGWIEGHPAVTARPVAASVPADSTAVSGDSTAVPGSFSLTALVTGEGYRIGVNRQSGPSSYTGRFYAGDGRLGAARVADGAVVTASVGPQNIGRTVLDRCSTVSGTVDALPELLSDDSVSRAAAVVTVFNDSDPELVTRSTRVNPDGSFSVTGLLPGAYHASARVEVAIVDEQGTQSFAAAESFYRGADPAAGESPNVLVPASCTDVPDVDFGAAFVDAEPEDVVAITPTRLLDAPGVPAFGTPTCVRVDAAGVPAEATGVLVNVASVSPGSEGNAVVFPDDGTVSPRPPTGVSVNFEQGRDVANAAFVKIGANRRVCVYTQAFASSRVVLDVTGFTMPDSGVELQTSQRLLDTRAGASHLGELGALAANRVHELDVAGRAGVPADAKAVVLNVAAITPAGSGHLRVYPADGSASAPDIATVNYTAGRTKSNAAVVPLGIDGRIAMYSDTFSPTPTDVALDVTGYIAGDGETYQTVAPQRILDTRPAAPSDVHRLSTLTAGVVSSLDILSTGVVPAEATGVVLNVTAIRPTTVGNLRVYPDDDGTGATPPPGASQINYVPGRDIPNLVVVGIPPDGRVNLFSDQLTGGTVDLAVDVVGYTTSTG